MKDHARFTFLVGGKAGTGVKSAATAAAELFRRLGRRSFQNDDYQSLIRGGHSFSTVTSACHPVFSQYRRADLAVCFDERSVDAHRDHIADKGVLVYDQDKVEDADGIGLPLSELAGEYPRPDLMLGVGALAVLGAAIGLKQVELAELVGDEYARGKQDNLKYAAAVYEKATESLKGRFELARTEEDFTNIGGNEAVALGAAAAGLDLYFAYPMTPATSILHFLAAHGPDLGVVAVHPENEIAVVNMAIGAAFAGARAMVGTSGGGYALMQEGFSLAGMTEAPLLCVVSSRPGPSTGVPTYTAQADLNLVLNSGHGEFPRVVASPGTVEQAFCLAADLLTLAWRFQVPAVLLTEKHLSECRMSLDFRPDRPAWAEPVTHAEGEFRRYRITGDGVSPLLFPPSDEVIKWSSYEHDEAGYTTEARPGITAMQDKRLAKAATLEQAVGELDTVRVHGEGPLIVTWGSTLMSVLEALEFGGIAARVVQPLFLEPLPVRRLAELRGRKPVVVEQSATGSFARLLRERAGVEPGAEIRQYDGRPFDPEELAARLKEAL
ncbi:2-oxoacid:acceptor oxidoreductase subunit alpha [candidate division WOR-3 bacterium]|nr:2-oxoacid:acceptor oxidoreductase subunit alpha [candidate division WOR-3 bacterium]